MRPDMTMRPAHWRGVPSTTFSTRRVGRFGVDGSTISAANCGSTRAAVDEMAEMLDRAEMAEFAEKVARRASQAVSGAIQCLPDRRCSAALALEDMTETREEAANPM